jgi:hypothetical protein
VSVGTSAGRRLRLSLGLWASLAFLVLWVGAAANLAGGGHLAIDSWTWLAGLPDIVGFAVWVLLLPVAVGLWASQTDPPAIVGGLVALGLVLWTAVAWLGLARTLWGHRVA